MLDELDIRASVRREVLVLHRTHGVALPAGQSDVLNLCLLEGVRVGGERGVGARAVGQDVRNADLDLVEIVEDVEFGQVQGRVVVDCLGVTGEDEIEPTAAAAPAGSDAEFLACDLQLLADFVELFRGEGAGADTGGVRFDDADDGGDAGGVQRETLDGTAQTSGRRGHEGISSVVKIEQESVGAFN